MKRLKNLFKLPILMIMMFIVQSCIQIETNMKVNSDFTGETVSKIKVLKDIITEEALKKELQEMGIQNYKLKKEESQDKNIENYSLEFAWKNEDELRKFLTFSGRNETIEELNEVRNYISSLNENSNNGTSQEGEKKNPVKEIVKIKDIPQIFKKEKGVVNVSMGTLNFDKLSIKVNGEIVAEENQSGVISSSKNEITFSKGENVSFKYKTKAGIIGKMIGYLILIILAILGLIGLKKFRDKKKENEVDPIVSDVNDDEINEIRESIIEDEIEIVEKDEENKDDLA